MNKKKCIYAGLIKSHNLSIYFKYKCNEGIKKLLFSGFEGREMTKYSPCKFKVNFYL